MQKPGIPADPIAQYEIAKCYSDLAEFENSSDLLLKVYENDFPKSLEELDFFIEVFKNAVEMKEQKIQKTDGYNMLMNPNEGQKIIALNHCRQMSLYEMNTLCSSANTKLNEFMPNYAGSKTLARIQGALGDFLRYKCKYLHEKDEHFYNQARDCYKEASKTAKDLSGANPIRLSIGLNFAVFTAEIMKDKTQTLKICSEVISEAQRDWGSLDSKERKISEGILNILQENERFWNNCSDQYWPRRRF